MKANLSLAWPLLALTFALLIPADVMAYYDPGVQRWINRDPVDETGFRIARMRFDDGKGMHPYVFVSNNAINRVDILGLKVWVCTVPASFKVGRHAYFWDDSPGTDDRTRECGMQSSSGTGGVGNGNTGPRHGETGNPWKGKGQNGDVECYPVEGSDGPKGQAVMDCCHDRANDGPWIPGNNDCHIKVDDCLERNGLKSPPHRGGTGPCPPYCNPNAEGI